MYPLLLTKDTIRQALSNINKLDICRLNVDAVLDDAYVCKADVTTDIICDDCDSLFSYVKSNIRNYNKYSVNKYLNGISISKNVIEKTRKVRLSIYDKGREMSSKKHIPYLNTLSDKQTVLDYYHGRVRYELNLNSLEQLRKRLHIPDTSLMNVMNSVVNPIKEVIDEMVVTDTYIHSMNFTLKDKEKIAFLQINNYDLERIEMILRSEYGKNYKKPFQKYQELCNQICDTKMPPALNVMV